MDIVFYGNYFQDNDHKEPIEWCPIRKYILQNEQEPQFLLISRKVLLSFKPITLWENSLAQKYLNDTFFDEAFTPEEKNNLIKFPTKDLVRIPFFQELYDDKNKKDFYNREILQTEFTSWAANGNAFEIKTKHRLSNGMFQMNPVYEHLVNLSLHPSWQILSGDNIFQQLYIDCSTGLCHKSEDTAFYGVRPCIKVKSSSNFSLNEIKSNIPIEYVKPLYTAQTSFHGTKIKINSNLDETPNETIPKFNTYGPEPKSK